MKRKQCITAAGTLHTAVSSVNRTIGIRGTRVYVGDSDDEELNDWHCQHVYPYVSLVCISVPTVCKCSSVTTSIFYVMSPSPTPPPPPPLCSGPFPPPLLPIQCLTLLLLPTSATNTTTTITNSLWYIPLPFFFFFFFFFFKFLHFLLLAYNL